LAKKETGSGTGKKKRPDLELAEKETGSGAGKKETGSGKKKTGSGAGKNKRPDPMITNTGECTRKQSDACLMAQSIIVNNSHHL
jgi:hypothetical protein